MFTYPSPPPSFLPSFHLSIHSSIQLFIERLLCSSLELHSEKTKGCSLGMERLKQLFKEGQTHSKGYTSPLSPPSPSSLFPYCALCSVSGPAPKLPSECWADINNLWMVNAAVSPSGTPGRLPSLPSGQAEHISAGTVGILIQGR